MYIVVSGNLQVSKISISHEESFLQLVGRGETIGEISLLINEPAHLIMHAIRDTILLELSSYDFQFFSRRH